MVRYRQTALAVRGDRFALFRLELGTADLSWGRRRTRCSRSRLDDEGRIALQVKFDVEDIDAALAELDAQHNAATPTEAVTVEPDNACARMIRRVTAAIDRGEWDEFEQLFATHLVESRRKIVGFTRDDLSISEFRRMVENHALQLRSRDHRRARRALGALPNRNRHGRREPWAPHDEMLQLIGLDEDGRVALEVFFDIEDIDAAIAELDAAHARFEDERPRRHRRSRTPRAVSPMIASTRSSRPALGRRSAALLADDIPADDRRRTANAGVRHGTTRPRSRSLRAIADLGFANMTSDVLAIRGERLVLRVPLASGRTSGPRRSHRGTPHHRDRRRRADRGVCRVRARRLRGRDRRARCPLPRRRSGRSRAHVVDSHGLLRRAESA